VIAARRRIEHYVRAVAGVKADTQRLADAGFEQVDCRNTWANVDAEGRDDQAFTRDLKWEHTGTLYSYERGDGDNKLYEITEGEANQRSRRGRVPSGGLLVDSSVRVPFRCAAFRRRFRGSPD
jgi:hypothetical protein